MHARGGDLGTKRTRYNSNELRVLNLDEKAASKREVVDDGLLAGIRTKIQHAGADLRANNLPRLRAWRDACDRCDLAGLCRSRPGGPARS